MTTEESIVNHRRSLLIYAERHGVSSACRAFGVSRTTYYKLKAQIVKTGSLAPVIRHKPKMPNAMALSKKKLLLRLVQAHPSWGPIRLAQGLRGEGIDVSSVCVWNHLKHFGLNRRFRRLVYLERLRSVHQPVTERSLRQLKRHSAAILRGLWPGHIVALDSFYVGHLKGVGRLYQLSGIDLCSRYGWAKLYDANNQAAAIDLVEQVLLPKFYANNVVLESVLTDNGSEFIGHHFQQMLAQYEIQHQRIPPGKPMLNGYCERFQRTILEEFYQPAFRSIIFRSIEQLQEKLNNYLVYYNFQRVHFGLNPKGAVPIDVLKARRKVLHERFHKLLA
jgi:transposase InsO family protein